MQNNKEVKLRIKPKHVQKLKFQLQSHLKNKGRSHLETVHQSQAVRKP